MTNSTNILHNIVSHVRGGGCGAGAWVAKVIGSHPKFGFEREFVQGDKALSRSGRSGSISWAITEPGIYEYRGVQYEKGRASTGSLASGFVSVGADGTVVEMTKADVMARIGFARHHQH